MMHLTNATKVAKGLLCSMMLAISLIAIAAVPSWATDTDTQQGTTDTSWTVSKSKSATDLVKQDDGTYTSEVTISLPSAQESLESDVVFCLDESDCNEQVMDSMWKLMTDLNEEVEESGGKLNVGVVFWRGCAMTAWELQPYDANDYAAFKQSLEDARDAMAYHGSNMASGLYAAKAMLESSDTPASRQHMILISDGKTYVYTHDQDPTTHYSRAVHDSGNYGEWLWKYGGDTAYPSDYYNAEDGSFDWTGFLKYIDTYREACIADDQIYTRTHTPKGQDPIPDDMPTNPADPSKIDYSTYIINVEEALYQSASAYQEIVDSGVKCYAYDANATDGGVFSSFIDYLANQGEGSAEDFEWITNSIIYLLDEGSVVEDVIGLGTDDQGNEYNFDFVNDASKLKLTVADKTYACTEIEKNHYGFGDYNEETKCYPYELVYHPADYPEADGEQEYLEWKFNVEISNFARASLTYEVVLTNPQTTAGTYTGLLTNRSAVLHAVATDGRTADSEFEKPEVSYTVPGGSPDTDDDPDDDNPDDSDDPDTPDSDDDDDASDSTAKTTSLRSNVQTGDESMLSLALGIALASGAAVAGAATYRRRQIS